MRRLTLVCFLHQLIWISSAITNHNTTYLLNKNEDVLLVQVEPKCQTMIVIRCQTSEVRNEPGIGYEMSTLLVSENLLTTIPDNVSALKKLKSLWLPNNLIDCVDMEEFEGLLELESIRLNGNQIAAISYPQFASISLPKLTHFVLSNNLMGYVNFEHWNIPSLEAISLSDNRLTVALFFPSKFVNLRNVMIHGNPWNCQWLDNTVQEFAIRKVNNIHRNLTTCKQSARSLEEIERNIKLLEKSTTLCQNAPKIQAKSQKLREKLEKLNVENANLKSQVQSATETIANLTKSLAESTKARENLELENQFEASENAKLTKKTQQWKSFSTELESYVGQAVGVLECLVETSQLLVESVEN